MLQFKIQQSSQARQVAQQIVLLVEDALRKGLDAAYVSISRESLEPRSSDQNRLMWPLLTDISKQVKHAGQYYSQDQWKDLLTASFEGVTQYAPNLEGTGFVAFGARTSKYNKAKMAEFIEFIYASGAQMGVRFSDKSEQAISEVRA